MMTMNILLVGSGGREHALAWKIKHSSLCKTLYCAPGNAGIADVAKCIDIEADDIDAIVQFACDNAIDLVLVGPEAPLVLGLADRLIEKDIKVFGPNQKAAQLEGSKAFMKQLCTDYNIPTAGYGHFTDINQATDFIKETGAPIVVKADGLAAGKGVIIAATQAEAIEAATDMLSGNSFGDAGHSVVIEEFMDGEELSFFALTDGKTVLPLASAQDHKRAFDNDQGPNTGGMGAYSPAHMMTDDLQNTIMETIIQPTVDGMRDQGCEYAGVLYAGIMIEDGIPKLLEYNIRFGDPECQPIMMRLETDIVALCDAVATQSLDKFTDNVTCSQQTTLCVVMAADGYPGSYKKGTVISNIEQANAIKDVTIFHAGTALDANGALVNVGGRVLGVTATGPSVESSRNAAYQAAETIEWPDGFYRTDIAWRALKKSDAA
jgi:phosphoribosylamine--glycine ligase